MYHSIPNDEVHRFKDQIRIIKQFTTPITLDYEGPFDSKIHYTIISFDDAFQNVITNGLPELLKYKIPITIFLPAQQLGRNPEWLKGTGHKNEHEVISSTESLLSIPPELVTFGSHTVNHNNLRQLDHKRALFEIRESKKMLESMLKREIKYFAFPYGNYNSKQIQYCYEVGYKQIFSTAPESPLTPLRNYIKGRTAIDFSDWKIEFILKILGGYGWKSYTRSKGVMNKGLADPDIPFVESLGYHD